MTRKITEMPVAVSLEDTDLLTGVDLSAAPDQQNVKITKANLHVGLAQDADLTAHKTSGDHDTRYYTETETDALLAGKEDAFAKNSAFNKDFAGAGVADTVSRSDHGHTGADVSVTGVIGNAVVIAADNSLEDGGVPPGGVGGSTNITIDQTGADNIVVESSTGTDGTIVPATGATAGGMSAADKTKLDALNAHPQRTAVTGSSSTWNTELNGGSYSYSTQDGTNLDTWSASIPAGGNNATEEYTASIDFIAPSTGTWTMTIPGAWKLMNGALPATLNAGDETTTFILRALANGDIQVYRGTAA